MDSDHGASAISRSLNSGSVSTKVSTSTVKMSSGLSKAQLRMPAPKELKLHELAMLSLNPIVRSIHRWWLLRAERHYLICADIEEQRAREAQMNVAYYHKQAAIARSLRN